MKFCIFATVHGAITDSKQITLTIVSRFSVDPHSNLRHHMKPKKTLVNTKKYVSKHFI